VTADRLQKRWDANPTWPMRRECAHCSRIFFCFTSWRRFCCPSCANCSRGAAGITQKPSRTPLSNPSRGAESLCKPRVTASEALTRLGVPLEVKTAGARRAVVAKCPRAACQKKPARRHRGTDAGPVCPRLSRPRAGWVRLHASPATSPGGTPRDLLTGVHALPCYPPPWVENACRSKLLRTVQWGWLRIRPAGRSRDAIHRGVPRAVSTRRGLLLPGLFDAQPSQGREWLAAAHEAGPTGPVGDLTRCRIVPLTPALSDPLRRVTGPKLLLALPPAPPVEPASLRLLLLGHDTATLRSCPALRLAFPRRSYSPRSSRTAAMRLLGPMPASRKLS
jgi:hypothetical protein